MVAETPEISAEDIREYLNVLGDRPTFCVIAKNHKTGKPKRSWLSKDEVVNFVKQMNDRGFQVWCSLNDKEKDSIEGTTALRVLFLDVDAKRKNKDIPATEQELVEAFKQAKNLLAYLENKYSAKGFIACSGNGWHIYFPLPKHELPDVNSRKEMNKKLRAFCKGISEDSRVKIDKTYDLRRMTAVIGGFNLKIPDSPIPTSWHNPKEKPFDVEGARTQNKALLGAIIGTEVAGQKVKPSKLEKKQVKIHELLSELIERDEKLKDLSQLDFDAIHKKYSYKSRSEAEMALLCKLVQYGFLDSTIRDVMDEAQIYSWHERKDKNKSKQIERAREFIANPEKPKTEDSTPHMTKKVWEVATNPQLLDYICKDITRTVKKDIPCKVSSFITALSMYTDDPMNFSQRGPTSIGKGYNANQSTKYFPEKDIWPLVGITKKAIVHLPGIIMDENDQQIQLSERPRKPMRGDYARGNDGREEYYRALETYRQERTSWDTRLANSYIYINLWHMTLLFQEAPEEDVLRSLFPILSHDRRRVEYKYTDPKTLITKTVVLEGWPATIFLDIGKDYMKEFSTRTLTSSPESSIEKIDEANTLTNTQASYPWDFEGDTEEEKIIRHLILAIKQQLTGTKIKVVVPFTLVKFLPKERARDMRDLKHFFRFLETLTALHVFQRPLLKKGNSIYAVSSVDDVIFSMTLYSRILETTRTGAQNVILKFYHDIVKQGPKWLKRELVSEYNKTAKRKLSGDTIGKWLQRLEELDYVNVQKWTEDKRLNVYLPLVKGDEKLEIDRSLEDLSTLRGKLEESFKEWNKNVGRNHHFLLYKNSNSKPTMERIEDSVAQQMILKDSLSRKTDNLPSIFKQLLAVKTEKQSEKPRKPKDPPISGDSKSERKPHCHLCGDDLHEGRPLSAFDGTRMVHTDCQELFLKGLETTQEEKTPEGGN